MSASVPSWARVGAKVVCIAGNETLIERQTYTITHVYDGRDMIGQWGVKVAEAKSMWGWHGYFAGDRFRPLITKSQSEDVAEHFRHHLNQPVDA